MEGEVTIKKALQLGNVHINRPLTNISLAYMQQPGMFVANSVFPTVGVQHQSDLYWVYKREQWNRDDMKQRAPATESAGSDYDLEQRPYYTPVWAVHKDVPDQIRANTDDMINPDRDATNWVTRKALIKREVAWADAYFKAGVWDTDITGVASGTPTADQILRWDDAASEPTKDIKHLRDRMLEETGYMPNVLVLGHKVFTELTENDSIIDRVKYGQTPGSPADVSRAVLAALFGVERVEVLSAIVNTSAQAEANDFIASPYGAALFYANPSPGLMAPSAGYTFAWTGYLGANAEGGVISRFRIEARKTDRVELEMAFAQHVVASDLGIFIANAITPPA
jgi:hypothetical protein